jgi:hypothetical protein
MSSYSSGVAVDFQQRSLAAMHRARLIDIE